MKQRRWVTDAVSIAVQALHDCFQGHDCSCCHVLTYQCCLRTGYCMFHACGKACASHSPVTRKHAKCNMPSATCQVQHAQESVTDACDQAQHGVHWKCSGNATIWRASQENVGRTGTKGSCTKPWSCNGATIWRSMFPMVDLSPATHQK